MALDTVEAGCPSGLSAPPANDEPAANVATFVRKDAHGDDVLERLAQREGHVGLHLLRRGAAEFLALACPPRVVDA